MKTSAGIVGAKLTGAPPMSCNMMLSKLPTTAPWLEPNAIVNPTITHRMLTTPMAAKDWTMVASTFLVPTSPP